MKTTVTDAETDPTAPDHRAEPTDPGKSASKAQSRGKLLNAVRRCGASKATQGISASRSQDFLYGDDGLSM
jgi:hypothetical protein